MIRRPPRSTHCISSAASDVYKRQELYIMPEIFECVSSCPGKYFIDSRKVCRPCPKYCAECSFKGICDVCEAGYKKWNSLCHEKCPLNTMDANGICTLCSPKCLTCQGASDFCTACKDGKFNPLVMHLRSARRYFAQYISSKEARHIDSKFSYEGKCYDDCVEGTAPANSTKLKYCLPCGEGCGECTHTERFPESTVCTKCSSGYSSVESSPPLTCARTRRLEVSKIVCRSGIRVGIKEQRDVNLNSS
eukprot:TRINITY_DN2702_c0_g3_i6.p1 TRINITY_DN2702_c0_g3~~TRINITY_DN2702_c0_g3_i6.p1  ORF type:complete len:255 (+),score=10.21 TRINITY_DN2702_c0_g3_i6:23-766(+)